ncbi:amidase family protein, partial [Amnimonas aquatica]
MSSANLEMAAATSTVHAFRDDALGDLDAVGVAERLRRGEVSAREVADAALARAEAVNPLLNAVVLTDRERIRQAGRTRRTGVFADVPTFIKDNTDLKGLPTRHGSRAVSGAPAAADSAFARQYL